MAAWSEMSAAARGGVGVAVAVVVVVLGWLGFGRTPEVELPAPVQVAAEAPQSGAAPAPADAAADAPAALAVPEGTAVAAAPAEAGAPKLDVLRVTPEGETTVAGQAAPGDVVSFQLDGEEILTATADASGNFVGLLTLPPSDAARMLSVVTKGADGVARAVDVAVAPVKGPVLAEVASPAADAPATDAPAPEVPALVAEAPAALLISPEGVKVAQSGSAEGAAPVAMQAITYAPDGAVQLTGKGTAGSGVRIYLDQALVSQAVVAADGSWGVTLGDTAPGIYTLRIDQIDAAGKVTGRFETPFKRETLEALAAASGAASVPATPVVTAQAAAPTAEIAAPVVTAETASPTPDATVPATPAEVTPPAATAAVAAPETDAALAVAAVAEAGAEGPAAAAETAPQVGETALAAEQVPAAEAAPVISGGAQPVAPALVAALPAPAAEPAAPAKTAVSITVQPGFTLWGIAKSQMGEGVMYVQVFEANKERIKNPDLIYPGQVFTIPGSP